MMTFDVKTALLFVGILYIVLPIFAWLVLARQRSQQVALWCGGGLLVGVAAILTFMQEQTPEWASLSLASLLLLLSSLMRIQSLRLDMGKPWRLHWMALFVIVFAAIFNGIHYGLQNPFWRAYFNFSVSAGLIFYLAWLAWRIGRDEQSPNAKLIAWVYILVAFSMMFRVYAVHGNDLEALALRGGLSMHVMMVSMLLSAVIGHFGYVGLALDRSTRRELKAAVEHARNEESHRLGEQIAQLDRQRSLGEISASLGHELNQPLTAILTNAQVAQRGVQAGRFDNQQIYAILEKIVSNTRRASQIIEKIRGFIRPTQLDRVSVDLATLMVEAAELMETEVRKHKIIIHIEPEIAPITVLGDATHLTQVIVNILRNAIESLQQVKYRKIIVTLREVEGMAVLMLCDSGPGLSAIALEKVGTPFFSTKENGLGMGLSISRAIMKQHEGELRAFNAEQGGACFAIHLPAIHQPTPLKPPSLQEALS